MHASSSHGADFRRPRLAGAAAAVVVRSDGHRAPYEPRRRTLGRNHLVEEQRSQQLEANGG